MRATQALDSTTVVLAKKPASATNVAMESRSLRITLLQA
jgi:hypothetical protein